MNLILCSFFKKINSFIEFAEFIGHTESQVVSDEALPVYARQLALHANVCETKKVLLQSFFNY